ncbi:MAG: hypothetical protein ABIF77_12770 [bacterium]
MTRERSYQLLDRCAGADPLADDQYQYGETRVEGEVSQVGATHGGVDHAHVQYLAGIATGRVGAYTAGSGYESDPSKFLDARGLVEHIQFIEIIEVTIPPGTYPDDLEAALSDRTTKLPMWAAAPGCMDSSPSGEAFDTGALTMGIGEGGLSHYDEPFDLTWTLASPGATYVEEVKVNNQVSVLRRDATLAADPHRVIRKAATTSAGPWLRASTYTGWRRRRSARPAS